MRLGLRREEQGSTGLGEEITVRRGKTDASHHRSPAPGRRGTGALKGTWGSPDGPRAKLIFTFTVPEAVAGDEHLRLRAMLSRKLMDAGSVSV